MIKNIAALGGIACFALAACTTTDPYTGEQKTSSAAKGAFLGALAGAAAGALTNTAEGEQARKNALIGAGIGALAGGAAGSYMDRQEAQLREQLAGSGVSVTRVGNDIILNMPGNITFATDSADLNAGFYKTLNSVSLVLQEFDQSILDVAGHTDNRGSDEYNQQLSYKRAQSVANYLTAQQVSPQRIAVYGFGEARPLQPNDTAQGMAANRRVELQISPLTNS